MSRSYDIHVTALAAALPGLLPLLVFGNKRPKKASKKTVSSKSHSSNVERRDVEAEQKQLLAELHSRLLALNVRGYERLIAELLRAAGYENVRILRDHRLNRRSHKGRNRHGGVDITAVVCSEFSTEPVLVQVKQYQRPVARRFVDELRGALLRTKARQGLLITTSTFAPAAKQAACEDHIGPIHLMDGAQLQELLVRYHLGVRERQNGSLAVQPRFFRHLEHNLFEENFSTEKEAL